MLILIPFLVVILIIVAINNIYYSDVKPKNLKMDKQIEKRLKQPNETQNYIDKYIKR